MSTPDTAAPAAPAAEAPSFSLRPAELRDVGAIVEELLPRFDVEREELARDALEFLADLVARGWVVPA